MRVVVVSSTVFAVPLVNYGGLEAVAYHCAKGLAAKGHEVFLIAPDGSHCDGVTVVPSGPAGMIDERMAYGGYPEHKEGENVLRRSSPGTWQFLKDADVVVDHSWQKWAYVAKAEGITKAPVLGVMHAPVRTMYPMFRWPPDGIPKDKACAVAISYDMKRQFEEVHECVAHVVHNGIDTDFYKPIRTKRTNRYLFCARFSSIKGADIAVEACIRAGVGLDLIGDTSITQEPAYYEAVKARCDGEQIRMIGPASRGDTVWWYSRAYCMLHPNQRFREPLGLAPLEAHLCGLPCLAWDYGAMRETVGSDSTYWLVYSLDEMVNKIKELSAPDGPFAHDLLGTTGLGGLRGRLRENAMKFSLEANATRYDELVKLAVNSGGW